MVVDLDVLERCLQYFRDINAAKLTEIIWMRRGKRLHPDPVALEEFAFTGLSNRYFPEFVGGLDDLGNTECQCSNQFCGANK